MSLDDVEHDDVANAVEYDSLPESSRWNDLVFRQCHPVMTVLEKDQDRIIIRIKFSGWAPRIMDVFADSDPAERQKSLAYAKQNSESVTDWKKPLMSALPGLPASCRSEH